MDGRPPPGGSIRMTRPAAAPRLRASSTRFHCQHRAAEILRQLHDLTGGKPSESVFPGAKAAAAVQHGDDDDHVKDRPR